MSTFLGSNVSGITIDDTQLVLTSNSLPVLTLQTANANVNFGGYSLTNFASLKATLDMGTNKITNVAAPTLTTDAVNKTYVDSGFYANTVPLNLITAPVASVALNAQKITGLANPTLAQDATTKTYVDGGFYANTVPLSSITAPSASLSLNSQKIINLATPTLATDAATKAYVDAAVASDSEIVSASTNTKVTVSDTDNLTAFTNDSINTMNIDTVSIRPLLSIDMGSTQKIINLANATDAMDAMNRQSGDARYYLNTVALSSIVAPTAALSLNAQKITNLADATLATDAMNRQSADARYYLNTVVLNSITAPTGSLSLNSQKITNLANATAAADAMNQASSDARYYLNTRTLDTIAAPVASVALNAQKITGLAAGIASTDAVNLGQLTTNQWSHAYLATAITTGFTATQTILFSNTIVPAALTPAVTANISYAPATGLFTLSPGLYRFAIQTVLAYQVGTNIPVSYAVVGSIDGSLAQSACLTNRAPALATNVITSSAFVHSVTALQTYKLVFTQTVARMSSIAVGTTMYIQQLQ